MASIFSSNIGWQGITTNTLDLQAKRKKLDWLCHKKKEIIAKYLEYIKR
jgi:hypothetical protein